MEAPDLISKYCYTSTKIPIADASLIHNMTYEMLSELTFKFSTAKDLVVVLIKQVEKLREEITYHNKLVVLHFLHRHETFFKEILQKQWPKIEMNKTCIADCQLYLLLCARLQREDLKVDTSEFRQLMKQINLLNTNTLYKDHELWKLVVGLESSQSNSA